MAVNMLAKPRKTNPSPGAGNLKMQQIQIAQWLTDAGKSGFSVIGLGTDGAVYRYQAGEDGWVPFSMRKVTGSNYGH